MKIARTIAMILLLFACANGIGAQDLAQDQDFEECSRRFESLDLPQKEADQELVTVREKMAHSLPLGASETAPPVSTAVSLIAGEENGRGVISYSSFAQSDHSTRLASTWGKIHDLSLKLSVPFNQSGGQAVFASLGGLSGDLILNGTLSRYAWDIEPRKYQTAMCQECKNRSVPLPACSLANLEKAGMTEVPQGMMDSLYGRLTSRVWGVEGSLGRKRRNFFLPDGAKNEEDRPGYSMALLGGMVFGEKRSMFGRITAKRDYEEQEKATRCSLVPGSVLESCSSLPLGRAQDVKSLIAALDARFVFTRFAIAPSAQYDFESEVWDLEAPVFVVRNDAGAFTGGVKVGWRSDQHDLAATIFVTHGLDLKP